MKRLFFATLIVFSAVFGNIGQLQALNIYFNDWTTSGPITSFSFSGPSPNVAISGTLTNFGPVDIVVPMLFGGTGPQYSFLITLTNQTSSDWTDLHFETGWGTAASFDTSNGQDKPLFLTSISSDLFGSISLVTGEGESGVPPAYGIYPVGINWYNGTVPVGQTVTLLFTLQENDAESTQWNSEYPFTSPAGQFGFLETLRISASAVNANVDVNVNFDGKAMPWLWSENLNPAFNFGIRNGTGPMVVDRSRGLSFAPGNIFTVQYLCGFTNAFGGNPVVDANGYDALHGNIVTKSSGFDALGSTGQYLPTFYTPLASSSSIYYLNALVGTFADDGGAIVGTPFYIGNGPYSVTVPPGATRMQLGVNDDNYGDNTGSLDIQVSGPGSSQSDSNPPTGSITINGGAEATKSTAVTLTLTASDETPGTIMMCISNTPDCTTWTTFAETTSWTLSKGDGTKTVYVWFKDVWGNTNAAPYSDTIILDTVAPTNGTVTATPGNAQVTLDWTGFADSGSGIGSYKVVFAAGTAPLSCADGTAIYTGTGTSYIHTGLTNGAEYGYRVCAMDKAGNISMGATASAKTKPESNPPTGSITINGGGEATKSRAVTLTLTASDDTPGAIRMCISNTPTCTTWTAFVDTANWTLSTGNGTKTVYIWFKDMWGNVNSTPYSDTITLDTIAPTNGTVTATPGDAQVTLDWTGFTDASSGIRNYKVVFAAGTSPISCSDGKVIYTGTDTLYIHKGLTNGNKYGYRVCAKDKAGKISTGSTASAKPRPETNPPAGSITIKGGAEATKSTTVKLTLTASDDTPGAIRMCISNTPTCTTWTALVGTTSWTIPTGEGTKTINVWFRDVWGNANAAPYSDTIILDTTAPTNGTATATAGDARVTLDWTGFTDSGSGIANYKVVFAAGTPPISCSDGKVIYTGTDTSYIHTERINGTTYGYRVCAKDRAGNISKGATASAKPQ